jgi:hypothetical protein
MFVGGCNKCQKVYYSWSLKSAETPQCMCCGETLTVFDSVGDKPDLARYLNLTAGKVVTRDKSPDSS